jgi:hypothetical protein
MAQYSGLSGESIWDVAAKLYPDIVIGISDLLSLNSGIDINADLFGVELEYTPNLARKKPVFDKAQKPAFYAYLSKSKQSHWDLALQLYGDISQIGEILKNNTDINGDIALNTDFTVPVPKDPQAVFFLTKTVATNG